MRHLLPLREVQCKGKWMLLVYLAILQAPDMHMRLAAFHGVHAVLTSWGKPLLSHSPCAALTLQSSMQSLTSPARACWAHSQHSGRPMKAPSSVAGMLTQQTSRCV